MSLLFLVFGRIAMKHLILAFMFLILTSAAGDFPLFHGDLIQTYGSKSTSQKGVKHPFREVSYIGVSTIF